MHPVGSKKNAGFSVVNLLNRTIHQVVFQSSLQNLFLQRHTLYFRPLRSLCSCSKILSVRKTYCRTLASLAIGEFHAHITQLTCSHCKKIYDSEELQTIVAPNAKFGFDVMVYIGEALFVRARNGKEIQHALGERNINISRREIDHLGRRFIVYLALAHEQSQAQLKALMSSRGGYILPLDGTCEGDSPHLVRTIYEHAMFVVGNV